MTTAVLFLDHTFRPLRVECWQRAVCDLMLQKVEVIAYSEDKTIQGVSEQHLMPSVVRVLRKFDRNKIRVKFSRLNIYARDAFTCQYCEKRFDTEHLTFDHVVPKSKKGKTTWENIVTCCVACNKGKADKTLKEAGLTLRRKPKKPTLLPHVSAHMARGNVPPEWRDYWTGKLTP